MPTIVFSGRGENKAVLGTLSTHSFAQSKTPITPSTYSLRLCFRFYPRIADYDVAQVYSVQQVSFFLLLLFFHLEPPAT